MLWKSQNPEWLGGIMAVVSLDWHPRSTSGTLLNHYIICMQALERFPFLNHHINTWPVTDAAMRYLSNHRKYKNAKRKKAAGLKHAEGTSSANALEPDAAGRGEGGDDYDDVELSE